MRAVGVGMLSGIVLIQGWHAIHAASALVAYLHYFSALLALMLLAHALAVRSRIEVNVNGVKLFHGDAA